MTDKINELLRRVEEFKPKAAAEIEEFRIKILGKKGELNALMEDFKTVAPELKRELGQQLNKLKTTALDRINSLREQLQDAASDDGAATEDMTRPGSAEQLGSRHPISLVKNQIVEVFSRLGYTVADGPEIEDDWHVFSALNFPPEHPARDMQDTFFIEKNPDILLRTHTSSIQVRTMEHQKPADPRHLPRPRLPQRSHLLPCALHLPPDRRTLHRRRGLVRRPETIAALLRQGALRRTDRHPHASVVLPLHRTFGRGRRVVQPLRRQGLSGLQGHGLARNPGLRHGRPQRIGGKQYRSRRNIRAFAFGMGIERIAMLKYGVSDLRLYFENDVRFLHQFDTAL